MWAAQRLQKLLNTAKQPSYLLILRQRNWQRKLFGHAGLRLDLKFHLGWFGLEKAVQEQLADLLYFEIWQSRLDRVQTQITLWPVEAQAV